MPKKSKKQKKVLKKFAVLTKFCHFAANLQMLVQVNKRFLSVRPHGWSRFKMKYTG